MCFLALLVLGLVYVLFLKKLMFFVNIRCLLNSYLKYCVYRENKLFLTYILYQPNLLATAQESGMRIPNWRFKCFSVYSIYGLGNYPHLHSLKIWGWELKLATENQACVFLYMVWEHMDLWCRRGVCKISVGSHKIKVKRVVENFLQQTLENKEINI